MARDVEADGSRRLDGSRPDDSPQDPRATLEVTVVALGSGDGGRWLAMGRLDDGTTVTFLTDARAAEAIGDAMASGGEPRVVVERWQLV